MAKKPIVIPSPTLPRKNRRINPKHQPKPVHLDALESPVVLTPPVLRFTRRFPKVTWNVPPITTPLYWFDIMMLRKKLIIPIGNEVFVCDGRRFRVLAQDYRVIGVGYVRWLVYEEHPDLPQGGKP